jgi:hypothetical protein
MKIRKAAPHAAFLIESLRDIGYSLDTALADIVDNAISAGASRIRIFADTTRQTIGILDDGKGMAPDSLFEAMRPGTTNPLDRRNSADLGRFGLGLKTASFSQCRMVTVVTKDGSSTTAARWDLDFVAKRNDWLIQVIDDPTSITWHDELGDTGTLVLWEKIDRVLPSDGSNILAGFTRAVDDAREHLELVFHRYLAGERGLKKVEISLNDRLLEPFDPFHSAHPATVRGPLEVIQIAGKQVTLQTFTLPHHRNVTLAEWDRYAGKAGYLKNQGFYVYREKRLIIHGTWFGLARQQELTKLTRVRVDMPSSLDNEWKIDVKKAWAQPPYAVRERLRRLIESIGATSKRTFTSRGRRLVEDTRLPLWIRTQTDNKVSYEINRDHPLFIDFAIRLPDNLRAEFLRVLEAASSALPVDAIYADLGTQPERLESRSLSRETLRHTVVATYTQLVGANVAHSEIVDMMSSAEPFRSNWLHVEQLIEQIAACPKEI